MRIVAVVAQIITMALFVFRVTGIPAPWIFAYSISFWAIVAIWQSALLSRDVGWMRVPRATGFVGMMLNAAVSVANGGYMPVVDVVHIPEGSVWRHAIAGDRLLCLADQNYLHGCSLGDCVILASFGVWAIGGITIAVYRHFEKQRLAATVAA